MVYLFLLELLIHRLGDPKCVVSEISGCSDMSVVIRYFMVSVRRTGTFLVYIYIRYLRKCAFPNDHGSPAFVSPTGRCPLTTGARHRGSTPTEGKVSVVSEHLFVGETKTANRVLQEIRTHFSRPVIG